MFGTTLLLFASVTLFSGLQEKNVFDQVCDLEDKTTECRVVNWAGLLFLFTIAALFVAILNRREGKKQISNEETALLDSVDVGETQ